MPCCVISFMVHFLCTLSSLLLKPRCCFLLFSWKRQDWLNYLEVKKTQCFLNFVLMIAVGMVTLPAQTASHTTEDGRKERERESKGERQRKERERRKSRKGRTEDKFTKLQSTEVNNDDVVSTVHPQYSKQCLLQWPLISASVYMEYTVNSRGHRRSKWSWEKLTWERPYICVTADMVLLMWKLMTQ